MEIDRIKELAKERGISISHICRQFNLNASYIANVGSGKASLSEDRLEIIAEILGTTPDYLHGKTDIKNKPIESINELTAEEREYLIALRKASPELQEAAYRLLGL